VLAGLGIEEGGGVKLNSILRIPLVKVLETSLPS
jgi:hypothetical protein